MKLSPRAGFTLIEMLVYLALLSVLMTGALLTVYQLLSDVGSTRAKVNTDEEANFVLRKMEWALNGASAVSVSGAGNDVLTVTRAAGNICIFASGTEMEISHGGCVNPVPISSANVVVSGLEFTHIVGPPEGVQVSTTINDRLYGITKYLNQ